MAFSFQAQQKISCY